MSDINKIRPKFNQEESLRIVENLYHLEGTIKELPSERDQNYLVKTTTGDNFVLKIAASSEKRKTLEFQNDVMNHISNSVYCPKIVHTRDDKQISVVTGTDNRKYFVRLLTYLPGDMFGNIKNPSSGLLFDLGRAIASLTRSLQNYSHPAAKREFHWDLRNATSVIRQYREYQRSQDKLDVIEYFLDFFEREIKPYLPRLKKSVIHNDANDYNIVIDHSRLGKDRIGIIDFGDMVHSHTIFELAVATTYAILGKKDPIKAAAYVIGGYHSVFPLTELELELLFILICTRLCMSVSIAAYQQKLEPENEYLKISEKPAWETLKLLKEVHPRFSNYVFRHACKMNPCPQSKVIIDWIKLNYEEFGPILGSDFAGIPHIVFDLDVGSLEFSTLYDFTNKEALNELLFDKIKKANTKVGVGRYNEARAIYTEELFRSETDEGFEYRTIHLGIDLFLKPNSPIYAPLDGRIHSFQNNEGTLDYGPTIILEHEISDGELKFFTLYGHLSPESLNNIEEGMIVNKGELFAHVGSFEHNGGWPPHLHFQMITDMLGRKGDFPGVVSESQRDIWLSICPDPNLILKIPKVSFPEESLSKDEILNLREQMIGPSLSISYKKPLKIVRGYRQYLYDQSGRPYLDCVNNVCHVGHCHPTVVKALQEQAPVLNTNTRYLHDNLVKYAQRLCATLPEPLSVCFFVNSGSEANELALRLARTHTKQRDLIVVDHAYHGNTGSLIDISPYKFDGPGGEGPPSYVHKVIIPDVYRGEYKAHDADAGKKYADDVKDKIQKIQNMGKRVVAFICEPIMSCAGQIVFPKNYLQEAFRNVREAGGVCIADEVQIGFGRVGTHFWGFQTQDVVPDIVTMGKPMGNGHPLAAVVTTPEIANSFNTGMEWFNTFGGNPVSCAVGLAVLDVIENEKLQENAYTVGNYLKDRLKKLMEKHHIIGDVRGLGLFIGVELVLNRETLEPAPKQAAYIVERMKEHGVLLSRDGPKKCPSTIKIKPPLVFTKENADFFVNTLDKVLAEDFVNIQHEGLKNHTADY
ncbi:aminotransferase class III-fold pyridoxal phosphate-dependent enzyme [Candidatus Pacearchaeota archaeon]|nr:aminotransferase class III-fold pyridoxal phosphate-dependent enzyme [Candidatus Pacearchaeota archaeon]